MRQFVYLPSNENSESLYVESALVDAIKNVQKFGSIPMAGKIDNETLKVHILSLKVKLNYFLFIRKKS